MEPQPQHFHLPREWEPLEEVRTEWAELQALLPLWAAELQQGRAVHPPLLRIQYRMLLERAQQLRAALGPPPAVSRAEQRQVWAWPRLL